jgi:hypothetical protein
VASAALSGARAIDAAALDYQSLTNGVKLMVLYETYADCCFQLKSIHLLLSFPSVKYDNYDSIKLLLYQFKNRVLCVELTLIWCNCAS